MKLLLSTLLLMAGPLVGWADTSSFDKVKAGELPLEWIGGVTGEGTAKWSIVRDDSAPSQPQVLKQSGEGTFVWCVQTNAVIANGFVETKFKTVAGKQDQAAGLVWRWQDADNYYVARANALEDNVRIYRVIKGVRRQFGSADVKVSGRVWHTLRVDFHGSHFVVTFDGRPVLGEDNDTLQGAGAVGVWTKADSVILFDDFDCAAVMLHDAVMPK